MFGQRNEDAALVPALIGEMQQAAALDFIAKQDLVIEAGEIFRRHAAHHFTGDAKKLRDIEHTCHVGQRIEPWHGQLEGTP